MYYICHETAKGKLYHNTMINILVDRMEVGIMKLKIFGTLLFATTLLLSFDGFLNYSGNQMKGTESEIRSFGSSNDTYSDSQWYINNPGSYTDYSYETERKRISSQGLDMNVSKAWDYIKQTENAKHEVVVAVIDTGIDYNHPDLKEHMWKNPGEIAGDKIDNDHNGYIDDVYGWDFYNKDASTCHYDGMGKNVTASFEDNDNHGTHIAGIIAAVADNKIGIAGVASDINIKIMTLKVNGGNDGSGSMEDAVAAIKYAEMMGADICNISWGAMAYTNELKAAIENSNMLFVAAAGNFDTNNDEIPVYPASFSFDNVISVTAVDSKGLLGEKADYGMNSVDIAAPGIGIYSTVVGGYGYMSGTSMAAPQVTASAALLYATNDKISAADMKKLILQNINPIPELNGLVKNAGIPDTYQLIKASAEENKNDTDAVVTTVPQNNQENPNLPAGSEDLHKTQYPAVTIISFNKEDILPVESLVTKVNQIGEQNSITKIYRTVKNHIQTDRKRCLLFRRI